MSFAQERTAFEHLQKLLGEGTIYLIDTYDTLEGARRAAALGKPLWGVRLDSGSLVELAPAVRKILDDAGLPSAKIFATGDLNEHKIHELVAARAPIDAFGVGTELATSADAPSLGVVYKMVEIQSDSQRFTSKLSQEKRTLPGAKQIFRMADHDVLGRATECILCDTGLVEALQRPVILRGKLVEPLATATEARQNAMDRLNRLPAQCHSLFAAKDPWRVELSPELAQLDARVRQEVAV